MSRGGVAAERFYLWLRRSRVHLALAPYKGHTSSLRTYGEGSHADAAPGATRNYFSKGRGHTGPSERRHVMTMFFEGLLIGLGVGFGCGYGVRARISRRRRAEYRRRNPER